MPGLSAEKELELLEEKVERLTEEILSSKSFEQQQILTKEFDKLINKIVNLFKFLNKIQE